MSDDKYGETRVQVITDIDDTVKSSGGLRLLGKLGRALALFSRVCPAARQDTPVPARTHIAGAHVCNSVCGCVRVGVNIGPALGGLDTQYKRNDFYPGVFQFGAELAAYGLRACACVCACACACACASVCACASA